MYTTSSYGGSEGIPYNKSCPNGATVNRLYGYAGTKIHQVCGSCSDGTDLGCRGGRNMADNPVPYDTKFASPISSVSGYSDELVNMLGNVGTPTGTPFTVSCPSGSYINGLNLRASNYVNNIGFTCNAPAIVDTPPALTPTMPTVVESNSTIGVVPTVPVVANVPAVANVPEFAIPRVMIGSSSPAQGATHSAADPAMIEALKKVAAVEAWAKTVPSGTSRSVMTDDSGKTTTILTSPDGTTKTTTVYPSGKEETVVKARIQSNNLFLYILIMIVFVFLGGVLYSNAKNTTNNSNN